MGILFQFIDQEQSKKPDQHGISWNTQYGASNNCTNLHMSLPHQSVLIKFKLIKIAILYLFNKKCKTIKERKKK